MRLWLTAARRSRVRRGLALSVAALLAVPAVVAHAAPPRQAPRTPEQERVAQRERRALADLAESRAGVRRAAVALSSVAAQLPQARNEVARARGGLAGAQATLTAANAELERAEQARAAAAAQVDRADERVARGREEVGLTARRTYQRGRLGDLQEVMDAADPQDVLERATMLRAVFAHQDETLRRLTTARLSLARRRAGLAAEERAVEQARERAQERQERAAQVAADAEAAQARVAALVATRSSALRAAERERAADTRDYRAAQAASRALAERIREAARRAAAAEARRKAAAAAAARRAALRQAAADRAAAERRAAEQAAADRAQRRTRTRSRPAPVAPVAPQSTSGMQWPCTGCPLTSTFGWRIHPIFGDPRFHAGIDMGAPIGTPARAADGGTVIYAGQASGYGTLVVVTHGSVGGRDLSTAYAHLSRISVSVGQPVSRGQQVGEVGNEGNSTGPHLHFEVRRDGEPVDPLGFVSPP